MKDKGMIQFDGRIEEPRDSEGFIMFEELDVDALKEKFNLSKLTVHGDRLYVACSIDEFYIKYVGNELTLFHKNSFGNKRGYHRESKKFGTIFKILAYCKHHNTKYNGLGHDMKKGLERYGKSRMELLFAQIATA